MAGIRELVEPVAPRELYGRVQVWVNQASDRHGRLKVEFERKRDGLSFRPARFLVSIIDAEGKRLTSDPEPWDERVDDDLVSVGASAFSEENEAERLGYYLKARFADIEVRFGDGYFDSVMVVLLQQEGFADYASVRRCLNRIATGDPRQSPAYENCYQQIRSQLASAGSRLRRLGYAVDAAERILANAVAYYLDERFNVTNRERLGFS